MDEKGSTQQLVCACLLSAAWSFALFWGCCGLEYKHTQRRAIKTGTTAALYVVNNMPVDMFMQQNIQTAVMEMSTPNERGDNHKRVAVIAVYFRSKWTRNRYMSLPLLSTFPFCTMPSA
jgi:hypothetical protein